MKPNRVVHVNHHMRPGGGPAGYLYNLNKLIENDKNRNGTVKVETLTYSDERLSPKGNSFDFLKKTPVFINNMMFIMAMVNNFIKYGIASIKIRNRFKPGDELVFHDQIFAYVYKLIYGVEISVMPHQPKDLASEASELYAQKYYCSESFAHKLLSYIEFNVYENAGFLILPCKSSIDAYFIGDENKRKILCKKKIIEVTSSVVKPIIEKKIAIEKGKELIVGFIGRYNFDKGFDEFSRLVLNYRNDISVKFISAGTGVIDPIASPNYTDLGWRTDIGNIIDYCDILVVPNRVTYFDLLPIESLLLGTPVCLTNVGGNKFFIEKLSGKGVYQYNAENLDDFDRVLDSIKEKVIDERTIMSVFDSSIFLDSHKNVVEKMKG